MSEFFLELFSEEIPSNLQQNLRKDLLKNFNELFIEKSILFKKSSSYSTPNRLVILFQGVQKNVVLKSEEIKGPNIKSCLLYTSPSPRDRQKSRMPSSA